MMTDEQKFKFWQEWRGEHVELSNDENFENSIFEKIVQLVFYSNSSTFFSTYDGILYQYYKYARPIQKKTRLMTLEELADKWVMNYGILSKINDIDEDGGFFIRSTHIPSVKELYENNGKWNDKPSFEGLKSLMVEVSE
jgi:hypothetical protein